MSERTEGANTCRLRATITFVYEYDAELDHDAYRGLTPEEAARCDEEGIAANPEMFCENEPIVTVEVLSQNGSQEQGA